MKQYKSEYTGTEMDASWGKANTAVQGVKVNGEELPKDAEGKVAITLPDVYTKDETDALLEQEAQTREEEVRRIDEELDKKAEWTALSEERLARQYEDEALGQRIDGKQDINAPSLQTSAKQIVPAINELKGRADDNHSLANDAYAIGSEALTIAKGANRASVFNTVQALVTAVNSWDIVEGDNRVGNHLLVIDLDVPDFWISQQTFVEVPYTYTTDEQFIQDIVDGGGKVQVGFYFVSFLETQKVDLTDYYNKTQTDNLLNGKVDKVAGKGLSTNDYTTAEKNKLAELENYDDTAVKARLTTIEGKEAGWDAKQDALSAQQLQNIEDVPNKANDSDVVKHTPQTLTDAQKEQARKNIGSNVYCVIKQTQQFNIPSGAKGYSAYTMSNIEHGYCPISFVERWRILGGEFDSTTGYFSLNGLSDISYQEAVTIEFYSGMFGTFSGENRNCRFGVATDFPNNIRPEKNAPRTLFPISLGYNDTPQSYSHSIQYFGGEVIAILHSTNAKTSNLNYFLERNRYLRELDVIFDVSTVTSLSNVFVSCGALKRFYLYGVKADINLSYTDADWESIKYLITNSIATSGINVNLWNTALQRAQEAYLTDPDSDIENYPTLGDWTLSKNITLVGI